jgi:hypothetical protein
MINIALNKKKTKAPKKDNWLYDQDEVSRRLYNNIPLTKDEIPRESKK